jgi:hypothetical protein
VRLLPSEVSRIRYEDQRAILLDYYREHKPRSISKRYTGDTDSAGNKLTEEVFAVVDNPDKFFKRMPITEIAVLKIKDYVKSGRKECDADATIRRQLGNPRSAFTQAKALDLITDNKPSNVLATSRRSTAQRVSRCVRLQYLTRSHADKAAPHANASVFQRMPLGSRQENYLVDGR